MSSGRLLYLAFWFPPSRASGVYRALGTTQAFVDAGWDVTVVTTDAEYFSEVVGSTDESLLPAIPDGVDVRRVPMPKPRQAPDYPIRNWVKSTFPGIWGLLRKLRGRFERRGLDHASGLVETYTSWIEPARSEGRRIASEKRIDHILASGNPYSSFEVAARLADDLSVPYTIDYRDPWTIVSYTAKEADLPKSVREAEAKIVAGAHACVHVNEPLARAYSVMYPEFKKKMVVVENGFDPLSVRSPIGPYAGGPIRAGMLGTVTDLWPMDAVLQGWEEAREGLPAGSTLVLGGHLGYFARSKASIESGFPEEATGFRYVGPVPKANVAEFYESLDIIVVPIPGGRLVTSGKVYEAVAQGVPVVCVQADGGDGRRIADEYSLGASASPLASEVARRIVEAASLRMGLTTERSEEARRESGRYERSRLLTQLVEVVQGPVGR
jgi:glycosyltransferase involved in cell wall biosynthesis